MARLTFEYRPKGGRMPSITRHYGGDTTALCYKQKKQWEDWWESENGMGIAEKYQITLTKIEQGL